MAAGIWDLISGGAGGAAAASLAVRRGMQLFRQGDVAGSLAEFDRAIDMDPRQKQYLWQRGLSLYYLDRFEEGAEQFRIDVAANPNDTEESIWCFLCEAQVGLDSRPVMREAYVLLKVISAKVDLVANFSSGSDAEIFYSSLYAGLYYESQVRRLHGFPCTCPLPVPQLEFSVKEITIFKRTRQFGLDPVT
ncbi:unnamed protein product [Miscanthus lutarioriparius]|uniref:Uncharacterized protein n=1 Tax=Miscanthus lutarioriparius TaxID=422564 RepID=A0A811P0Y4_9POAL|nr:unnamed protein product [Miscanthus lutarioriparius]